MIYFASNSDNDEEFFIFVRNAKPLALLDDYISICLYSVDLLKMFVNHERGFTCLMYKILEKAFIIQDLYIKYDKFKFKNSKACEAKFNNLLGEVELSLLTWKQVERFNSTNPEKIIKIKSRVDILLGQFLTSIYKPNTKGK